jgi:hypothetical protein
MDTREEQVFLVSLKASCIILIARLFQANQILIEYLLMHYFHKKEGSHKQTRQKTHSIKAARHALCVLTGIYH